MTNEADKVLTLGLITAGAVAVGFSLISNEKAPKPTETPFKPDKPVNGTKTESKKSYLDAD